MHEQNSYAAIIETPWRLPLGIQLNANKLAKLDLMPLQQDLLAPTDSLAQLVVTQLQAYFQNPSAIFNLPLYLRGTPFQHRVWQALQTIPVGNTLSYSALAEQLKSGARAVGNACRNNPLPLIFPCHRIIAKHGGLGGFSGARLGEWLRVKEWLLEHEKNKQ